MDAHRHMDYTPTYRPIHVCTYMSRFPETAHPETLRYKKREKKMLFLYEFIHLDTGVQWEQEL